MITTPKHLTFKPAGVSALAFYFSALETAHPTSSRIAQDSLFFNSMLQNVDGQFRHTTSNHF